MIQFKIKLENMIVDVVLEETMNMQEAFYYIYQKEYTYAYLHHHKYVEKLNQTFMEAGIQYGEYIEVI